MGYLPDMYETRLRTERSRMEMENRRLREEIRLLNEENNELTEINRRLADQVDVLIGICADLRHGTPSARTEEYEAADPTGRNEDGGEKNIAQGPYAAEPEIDRSKESAAVSGNPRPVQDFIQNAVLDEIQDMYYRECKKQMAAGNWEEARRIAQEHHLDELMAELGEG